MADRVLIEIVGKSQGLDEVNAQLDAATKKEKELIDQMSRLQNQKQQWTGAAKVVQEFEKDITKVDSELKETRKSIEELSKAQKKMPGKVIAEETEKSFRQVRREIEEQIKSMRNLGQAGTEEYKRKVEEAGRLNDIQSDVSREIKGLASDTYAFDTILEGTQLVAGGFSVAQGSMALFGAENEDLQKAMVKLQGIIAITTGLQQIQNVVQKESNIMRGISIIQTKAKTAAEALSTKGTISATIAQGAFNIVAAMNPYLLLFTGLGLAVGALFYFIKNTESAAEAQKKMNENEKVWIEMHERKNNKLKEDSEREIKVLERELELMKSRGESEGKIRDMEDKIAQKRELNYRERRVYNYEELKYLDENQKKLEKFESELEKVNLAKAKGAKKVMVDFDLNGNLKKSKVEEAINALQGKIDNTNKKINIAVELNTEGDDLNQKQRLKDEERRKEDLDKAKRSAQSLAEYRVLVAKDGSKEELKAQIAALNVKLNNEIKTEGITQNEILLKRQQTKDAIQKLNDDFNKKQLQDEVAFVDAQLAVSKELDLNTYNLRIAQLEDQKKVELSDRNLTANQKLLIENKYIADLKKLEDDYIKYVSETESNTKISDINAKLAISKKGSEEEYKLRVELAKANAESERDSAQLSIVNETERVAKIKEINAQLQAEIKELADDYNYSSIQNRTDAEILETTKMYEKGLISKSKYEKGIRDIEISNLEEQIKARKENGENTVDLEKELSDKCIAIAKEEAEARKQIFEELYNLMGDIGNFFFDKQKQQLEQEMNDLNHYYTSDVEEAKKNKELKLISETEMANRQLEIKRKQAKAEKDQALFNAVINAAVGITKALASAPPPFNIVLAAITAAAAAIQIASITSKPLPKYWKGRKWGKGEYAIAGEYGPELMWIPSGASIMPHRDTQRALAGNTDVFERWNMPRINPDIPQMPNVSQKIINQYNENHKNEDRIDYEKLGRSVAKHMKFPRQKDVSIHFDKSGLSVTDGNTTTNNKNFKYIGHV
jgi:hypothetical protein